MEPESGLIFKNIPNLANLNSRNKNCLHIKLLKKEFKKNFTLIL